MQNNHSRLENKISAVPEFKNTPSHQQTLTANSLVWMDGRKKQKNGSECSSGLKWKGPEWIVTHSTDLASFTGGSRWRRNSKRLDLSGRQRNEPTISHLDLTSRWPSCWRDGALEKQKHWHRTEREEGRTARRVWPTSAETKTTMNSLFS